MVPLIDLGPSGLVVIKRSESISKLRVHLTNILFKPRQKGHAIATLSRRFRLRLATVCMCACVRVCGHHFQQTGHQPGMVANPAPGSQRNISEFNWIVAQRRFFNRELV